ncbi:MAG: SdrD B-like domain-containing protein [Anaerolineales bacterium]
MKTKRPIFAVWVVIAILLTLAAAACNLQAPEPAEEATATTFAFPTATEPAATGSIAGLIWEDQCQPPAEGVEAVPEGCVEIGENGDLQADGILSPSESGIEGVQVRIGEGACPAFGLATATTDASGAYRFEDLNAGTYCLSVDASGENEAVLMPGVWTFPVEEAAGAVAQQSVTLSEAAVLDDVNFGWDPQPPEELPPTETPTPTPEEGATETPTPTATLDPSDPKAGLGEPRFEDDLDTGGNWTLYQNDQVEFSLGDGQIDMKALEADFSDWWTLAGPSVADFYVEGVVGMTECAGRDEAGLVVRGNRPAQDWVGYLFAVTCDGRFTFRIWDGEGVTKLVDLTNSEQLTATTDWEHTLGVRAEGSTFTLFIDGSQVAQVTDDTYEQGLAGVFIGAGTTPGVEGYLDRIAIWDLP